jgi:amino acid adenylation domain-containing protein
MSDRTRLEKLKIAAGKRVVERKYWLNQLAGEWSKTAFPRIPPLPAGDSPDSQTTHFTLEGELHAGLLKLSTGSDVRLHIVLSAILTLLLNKYTEADDIVIGTPILKYRGRGEPINRVLVLRSRLNEEMSFKELLLQMRQTLVEADNHRSYPPELLARQLNLEIPPWGSPFFDVALVLDNIHDPAYLQASQPLLTFGFLRSEDRLEGRLYQRLTAYRPDTVKQIIGHFRRLTEITLADADIRLKEIDLLLPEERRRLLADFHHPQTGGPPAQTIHELFAQQVEKVPHRLAVIAAAPYPGDRALTYRELDRRADRQAAGLRQRGVGPETIVGIAAEPCLEMTVAVMGILKSGGAYLPLDPAYPQERLDFMVKDSGAEIIIKEIQSAGSPVRQTRSTLNRQSGPLDLAYVIYTSGSTGKPRGVGVNHGSAVNTLCFRRAVYRMNPQVRALQLFSCCFDGFVTSFFTPIVSGAAVILLGARQVRDILSIKAALIVHRVTHFIAVPSLYRALLEQLGQEERASLKLKAVTLAGEKILPHLLELSGQKIRDIEIVVEYGVTEAAVMSTIFRHQERDRTVKIGRPIWNTGVYVLNRWQKLQPPGVAGELGITGSGVSRGYLNNPELTADRFVNFNAAAKTREDTRSPQNQPLTPKSYILYRTGDLCRRLSDGNIEFLGRIDFQVKIRGFRIEPTEIEEHLLKHPGVKAAVVTARQDPQGDKYLCAYIVPPTSPTSLTSPTKLRQYLSGLLPEYMVPAHFVLLDSLPINPGGKVDRRSLPEPRLGTGREHVPPGSEIEKRLVEIWREILPGAAASIGVHDNFFQLGGHSLNTALLASRLHQVFGVEIPLSEVFRRPTVRQLAAYIGQARPRSYEGIEPVENREYYPLSSAQKRLYFLQEMAPQSTAYNMAVALPLARQFDHRSLEAMLRQLAERHESLRTSFFKVDDRPVQKIQPPQDIAFDIHYYESEKSLTDFVRPFDLSRAPLMRLGIVRLPGNRCIWLLDLHHIVSDGTSHMILVDDFMALYRQEAERLKPLKLQYKDFSQWQNGLITRGRVKAQEEYWLRLYADSKEIPRLNLPTDYKRPEVFSFKGSTYRFILTGEEAIRFKTLGSTMGGTLYMNLLTALNALFYRYTDQADIIIGTGIAGRPHPDLQQIMGMFVNTLAMRNQPRGSKSYESFLREVITNSIRAFENQDVQFEELVDKLEPERDASRNPLFDILMVVQNFRPATEELPQLVDSDQIKSLLFSAKFDITLFAQEQEGTDDVYVLVEYYTAIFKEETIVRLVSHFRKLIRQVALAPSLRLDDIEIITEEEKQQLLDRFNDTFTPYPRQRTLGALFEDQVERNPWAAAVVLGDESVSYRTLDEQANRLANYLNLENGVRPGEPVGLLMDRAISMMVAIFGILKAGGAYVPVSLAFPQERIRAMIDDAGVRILIGHKRYIKTLNQLLWECKGLETFVCLDSEDVLREDEAEESELMNRKLWEYVGETSVDEVTGGGWNSSYTGQPIPAEEMAEYGDNILKKLKPLLHKGMRVLEIGAASGISMYRLAPGVKFYYGTDLSGAIIEKNRQRIQQEGHGNIRLRRLAAHEIDQLEEGNFDLVIFNSVVQCFKGHNYLTKVIGKVIHLLADEGHIFIGDIMDLDLKEALIADLTAFKQAHRDKGYKTKTDWSEELFLSRAFLEDLKFVFPEIRGVSFSPKIYTIDNELTRFRYDALFSLDKQAGAAKNPGARHKRQHDLSTLRAYSPERRAVDFGSHHLAYIIYTSGSTGNPKGTLTGHYNVSRVVKETNYLDFRTSDRVLQLSDYAFDGSVFDIYGALLNGAALVMVGRQDMLEMDTLCRLIKKENISVFFVTTALFNTLVDVGLADLSGVRKILFGGERVSTDHAAKALQFLGRERLIHVYGPTETTVYATYYPIHEIQPHQVTVPIGRPIANTSVYILDRYRRPLPIGIGGEVYIGGSGLGRGYLNNPELTAQKFITAPATSASTSTGQKNLTLNTQNLTLYKTGDLCRFLTDGSIEFIGRIDHQVKIRGFRIELGEIESHLLKHPLVREALVLDQQDGKGDRSLVAYIVPPPTNQADPTQLREFLSRTLPDYMIPAYFVPIARIPLKSTGKVDKRALPSPQPGVGEAYTPPGDELERRLTEIWAEVLALDCGTIGIDDNFFERGGHSLRATVLISKIQKELAVRLPLAEVFKSPSIRELARFIRPAVRETVVSIRPVEKREYYPLSSAQSRFYILQQVTPRSTAYNMAAAYLVEGPVDREKFNEALRTLIRRHEVLRTSFHSVQGRPVQRVADQVAFDIQYSERSESEVRSREARFDFIRPFDLSTAPLLRLVLVKMSARQHILMFDMHHIITDGTSMSIFLHEFMTLYGGGKLPRFRLQYKDFACWQQGQLTSGKLAREEAYWQARFPQGAGSLPVLDMPTDFPRPAVQSFAGETFTFGLAGSVTAALQGLMRETGTTLYMVLLAVINILLSRCTGQEDIVVGTTIAGRFHPDLQQIMGLLIETLVERHEPRNRLAFRTFLAMVKQETLAAHENQAYPFREIIQLVGADNEVSRNPVFDVMLVVQNFEAAEFKLEGLAFSPLPAADEEFQAGAKVDFTIEAAALEESRQIHLSLEYCTRLYRRQTMERLARHFTNIIAEVVKNPDLQLKDIEVIDEGEKRQLLETFNPVPQKEAAPVPQPLPVRFARQVNQTPQCIAALAPPVHLSYGELDERANRLALRLLERGGRPDDVVAIMLEPSPEMAVAVWGVLKAGAAYLPIDTDCPPERLSYMLADSCARIIVTDRSPGEFSGIDCLLPLGHTDEEMNTCPAPPPPASTNLAYMIYTSGSTGRAKGVLVEHRNLAAYIDAFDREFELAASDTVAQLVSYAFDASVEQFYPILLKGGKLAVPSGEQIGNMHLLADFINRQRVTVISCSPQLLHELDKAAKDFVRTTPNPLSWLRIMISGGDRLRAEYIGNLLDLGEVYNTYGPTEATVCATYYRCPASADLAENVPIGNPITHYRLYVLDPHGLLLPIGVPGELCIAGPGVTRGYLNNPELTADKFVNLAAKAREDTRSPNYYILNPKSQILYKTGDRARWLADGSLEFWGRLDRQVKIRGYRIEPAEIEARLTAAPNITDAVVVADERKSGEKYLRAYVVSKGPFGEAEARAHLARQLPDYMIPAFITEVSEIPRTGSGKLERARLPQTEEGSGVIEPYSAPRSPVEKQLAEIWADILEKEPVGIDDNFFDLGGNSLDIIKLNTRIKEEFGRNIPVVSLFTYTTIRTLAPCLAEDGARGSAAVTAEAQPETAILEAIEQAQQRLKGRLRQEATATGLEIAVIGLAARFPGADDIAEFWENLKNGVESIQFFSSEELQAVGVEADLLDNPNYVGARGIVAGAEYFDAAFFGVTPLEAQLMDPQMRVFEQCVWHALEDAGYNPFAYSRRIGLYAGASANFFWEGVNLLSRSSQGLGGFLTAQLVDKDFMCTHISYKLNLKGPSCAVATACSTSLVAIHQAVQGLLLGECEMALAGGVSIAYPQIQGYIFQPGMIFSPDGHNRSFAAEAEGSVFGDGAGVVLLKPLPEAEGDGDHIYAVIKGTAINNDGCRKVGYTAPSVPGQMEVIRAARLMAEVEAESITYIEAHGTATPLGDTVEIEALKKAFNTGRKGYCALGTVKSNMGHLFAAAGIAGFIKTVLALRLRLLPPTLHFHTPNPRIDFADSPFYVNASLKEWKNENCPRRAGVSSFGIGGTNAHLVLEEYGSQSGGDTARRRYQLILLSARSPAGVSRLSDAFVRFLEAHRDIDFADAAYTLQVGRRHFAYRRLLVSAPPDPAEEADRLDLVVQRAPVVVARQENRPVVFMFCGQGSQYVNMGIDLYRHEPVFRQEMDRCFDILAPLLDVDLKEILYCSSPQPPAELDRTEVTQPILFAFEYALARLLISWGIRPWAMIGYSFGEYIAACLAGVFSLEEALKLVIIRGGLVQQTPAGAMLSVPLPEKDLKPLLAEEREVWLAIVNGPTCIVSGTKGAVAAFQEKLKKRRVICVPLNMSQAIHSGVMDSIRPEFERRLGEFRLKGPQVPYVSNVTADWILAEEAVDPCYWGQHLCSTVCFADGLKVLLKQENAIFIEIGPGRILGMMVRVHPQRRDGHLILNTVKHPQESAADDYFLLEKLGLLWQHGQTIEWPGFYGGEKRRRMSLPTYPFEGKRYWIDEKNLKLGEEPGPEIDSTAPAPDQALSGEAAPRSRAEAIVAAVWKELMGLDQVGRDDDFFQLNGSSLLAMQIMARLMQEYDVQIPINRFYEKPTIANLAALLDEGAAK